MAIGNTGRTTGTLWLPDEQWFPPITAAEQSARCLCSWAWRADLDPPRMAIKVRAANCPDHREPEH